MTAWDDDAVLHDLTRQTESLSETVREADLETSAERLRASFAGFPAERLEFLVKHRNGTEFPASITTWWRWNTATDADQAWTVGDGDLPVSGPASSARRLADRPRRRLRPVHRPRGRLAPGPTRVGVTRVVHR